MKHLIVFMMAFVAILVANMVLSLGYFTKVTIFGAGYLMQAGIYALVMLVLSFITEWLIARLCEEDPRNFDDLGLDLLWLTIIAFICPVAFPININTDWITNLFLLSLPLILMVLLAGYTTLKKKKK